MRHGLQTEQTLVTTRLRESDSPRRQTQRQDAVLAVVVLGSLFPSLSPCSRSRARALALSATLAPPPLSVSLGTFIKFYFIMLFLRYLTWIFPALTLPFFSLMQSTK